MTAPCITREREPITSAQPLVGSAKVSCRLQEIFGGNAVSDEYAIGRHVANLFVTQTYEGQSDIHSTFLQDLLGLSAWAVSVSSFDQREADRVNRQA